MPTALPNRREMLVRSAFAVSWVLGLSRRAPGAEGIEGPAIGLGAYSCGQAWAAVRSGRHRVKFSDALSFLEYAKSLGAAGVQASLRPADGDTARSMRARAEALAMYYEGEITLPKDETDVERFRTDARLLREAGAEIARSVALGGRRYETFKSADEFSEFRQRSVRSLELAEPVLKQHRLRLAIENHKDWLVSEMLDWLRRMGSEWVGVCVDMGNNLALLEDPMTVVEALAPFALSSHIKDMAMAEYEDGFLLSEVPLGTGTLDLQRMVSILRKANPRIAFNLEMITRDPLRVPVLTPGYWATLGEMKAPQLAAAMARVRRFRSARPLPMIADLSVDAQLAAEEQNNLSSIEFAHDHLGL